MHRCVGRAAFCLALRLHSHAALGRGAAYRVTLPKLAQNLPAAAKAVHTLSGCRSLRAFAAAAGVTSTDHETLPGIGGPMLIGRADAYEGFLVSPQDLPNSSCDFDTQLHNSLQVNQWP